jgi:hypothetical protein
VHTLLRDIGVGLTGKVHPTLQFISHIPHSILGEQLVAQFCRCVPDKSWLFQHGRVPMNLIITDWLSQVWLSAPSTRSSGADKEALSVSRRL